MGERETMKVSMGNWWDMQPASGKTKWVDREEFVAMATKQLDRYRNESWEEFEVTNVKMILDERRFRQMAELSEKMGRGMLPVMTYHATGSPSIINSIAKYGYVLPGDLHPGSGQIMGMTHGNYLGDGVYTSTFFDVAEWFAFMDRHHRIQLVVNMTIIGWPFIIGSQGKMIHAFNKAFDYRNIVEHADPVYDPKLQDWFFPWVDPQIVVPVDGVYASGDQEFHSRMTGDLRTIVSASGLYVVPIFVVTLTPTTDYQACREYVLWSDKHMTELHRFDVQDRSKLKDLKLHRVCGDMYSLRAPETAKLPGLVHHHVIWSPASNSRYTHEIMHMTEQVFDSVQGLKSIWFWDREPIRCPVAKPSNLSSRSAQLCTRVQMLPVLDACLKFLTGENKAITHIVYLYLNGHHDKQGINDIVERWRPYVAVQRVIVKLIFLSTVDEACYNLKTELQTVFFYEKFYHFVGDCDEEFDFRLVFDFLYDENQNIDSGDANFCVPYPHGTCGQGFVTGLERLPEFETAGSSAILYKGGFTEYLKVNGVTFKTRWIDDLDIFTTIDAMIPLIARLRNWLILDPSRYNSIESVVTALCTGILSQLDELSHHLKQQVQNGDDCKRHLTTVRLIRSFYLRLQSLFTEISTFANVPIKGVWLEKLVRMKFSKKISKRAKHGVNLAALRSELGSTEIATAEDAISRSLATGLGIRVIRTSATELSPWLTQIEYVSLDRFSVSNVFLAAEARRELNDSLGKSITDVLLLSDTPVSRIYYAYVFTRNPYLFLSPQTTALPVVAFVRCLEMIFMYLREVREPDWDVDYLENVMGTVFTLVRYIKTKIRRSDESGAIVSSILRSSDFEKFFSAKHGVLSVCQLLGSLVVDGGEKIFSRSDYNRFAFAVMAEALTRSCRVFLRVRKRDAQLEMRRVLQITETLDMQKYEFDAEVARGRTSKFYRSRLTNCSPFAVVATLGFLERFHFEVHPRHILADFVKHKISMRNFLETNLPGRCGTATQVALFLHGLKQCESKERYDRKFDDPLKIIEEVIQDERQREVVRREQLESAVLTRRLKGENRLREAKPYETWHYMPRLFQWSEVDRMNLERPKDDQLELLDSGLLKHHCCYPECPNFLHNFATAGDKRNNTRRGLYRHLRHSQNALLNYVQGFHSFARGVIRRNGAIEFDAFTEVMLRFGQREKSKNNRTISRWFKQTDLDRRLRHAYDQIRNST